MDLKLTFGGASKGCVYEVTDRKPRWWAVMEQLSKQFQRDFSCVIFLILIVKLSNVDYFFIFYFSQRVNDTRDEKMLALDFCPKASHGSSMQIRCLLAQKA